MATYWIQRFADFEYGTPEHDAAMAWLDANGIDRKFVPRNAQFVDYGSAIQIQMFDSIRDDRFVSMFGGFAKCEKQFPLVAHPDDFGVQLETVREFGEPAEDVS